MDFDTWLIYLLAAVGLSLSPGPNGLLALTHGALHGWRKALYTIFGGAIGFILVIALSMFGIGALLQASLAWLAMTDSHFKCDTKSLVGVVPTVKEGTTRVTG